MKEIHCKDVRLPGCDENIRGQSEQEVVSKVLQHSKERHGLAAITGEIERKARKAIHEV